MLTVGGDLIVSMTGILATGTFSANMTGLAVAQAGSTVSNTARFGARVGTNTVYYGHTDASVTVGSNGAPTTTGTTVGSNAVGVSLMLSIHESVPATPLPTPVLTVTHVNPSTHGGTDGSVTVTWEAISGAAVYESCLLVGDVTTGFASTRSDATLTRTFPGLAAGTYTVAVRAMP